MSEDNNSGRMGNKNNSKSRLGQGLDAFFGAEVTGRVIDNIALSCIKAAPWQPRKHFDELDELAESIKIHGVLQPILVKKVDNHYEIIAGERRYRASCLAKLESIPAIVVDFSAQQGLEVSMIENLQRRDLNPIEKAEGFAFLIERLQVSQEELAKRLGINRSVIANFLRMNTLSEDIKQQMKDGKITAGHGKMLVNKTNAAEIAKEIVENKLSVREVENKMKSKATAKPVSRAEDKNNQKKSEELMRFQEMIAEKLSVAVSIECEKGAGTVVLQFDSLAQLEEIISTICFN